MKKESIRGPPVTECHLSSRLCRRYGSRTNRTPNRPPIDREPPNYIGRALTELGPLEERDPPTWISAKKFAPSNRTRRGPCWTLRGKVAGLCSGIGNRGRAFRHLKPQTRAGTRVGSLASLVRGCLGKLSRSSRIHKE